jgi:hypothetical protein
MDTEQIVRDFMAATTADITAAADFMTDDFSVTGMGPAPIDKAGYLAAHDGFNRAMPDRRFILSDVRTQGSQVSALVGVFGTHVGVMVVPIPGVDPVQPTGRLIVVPPTPMTFTLRDGKVAAIQAEPSAEGGLMGLLKQIGVKLPGA